MGLMFSILWTRYVGTTEYRLLMLGLDGAGKTTVLYKLKVRVSWRDSNVVRMKHWQESRDETFFPRTCFSSPSPLVRVIYVWLGPISHQDYVLFDGTLSSWPKW